MDYKIKTIYYYLLTLKIFQKKQPAIPLQQAITECGYVCAIAFLALHGFRISVQSCKDIFGDNSRGLSLRALRDLLRNLGFDAQAILYDPKRISSIPHSGIILLKTGHFILVRNVKNDVFEVFDPARGWFFIKHRRLISLVNGLGIQVGILNKDVLFSIFPNANVKAPLFNSLERLAFAAFSSRRGLRVAVYAVLAQILILLVPFVSQQSIDAIAAIKKDSNTIIGYIGIAFLAITMIGNIVRIISNQMSQLVTQAVSVSAAGDLFDRLAAHNASWHEQRPNSYALEKFGIGSLQLQFLADLEINVINLIFSVIVGFIALFFISPWLAVPGLVSMILNTLLDRHFSRSLSDAEDQLLRASQHHRNFVLDVVSQISLLSRFGTLWAARSRFRKNVRLISRAQRFSARKNAVRDSISVSIRAIDQLTFLCLGAYLMNEQSLSLGVFVAMGAYKDHLAESLRAGFKLWHRYQTMEPYRIETSEIFSNEPFTYKKHNQITHGFVDLINVTYKYGIDDKEVISNISMSFSPGEITVLIGASGSGKTTLAKIICGIIVPSNGTVLIDNEIFSVHHSGIGSVMQSDRLISATIRENVRMFRKNFSDSDVLAALDAADLKLFVLSLPMRLETLIGDGNSRLSGGQRQRIILARALLGKPKILVLDEATSNLDVESEANIMKNISASGCTLILCAHRPEVWKIAHKIYRIGNGSAERIIDREYSCIKTIEVVA